MILAVVRGVSGGKSDIHSSYLCTNDEFNLRFVVYLIDARATEYAKHIRLTYIHNEPITQHSLNLIESK